MITIDISNIAIRKIRLNDADCFSKLVQQVEHESEYMLWESGERIITLEQQKNRIESFQKDKKSEILVAEVEENLVGYLIAIGNQPRRVQHIAYIVVGIIEACQGRGIGKALFEALIKWAEEQWISRLELTVRVDNESAVGLYKRMGFEIEGIKRHSIYIDGKYVDSYYMALLLDGHGGYRT
ncbi:GNAT family N-acetyltransferase [Bacillus sp. B1-b2]|uniref:GNAT family N-acetyltransferase n=1 Tax=Bacillus sp. B1-b2 TaxID=2653201 RepID=UPI001D00B86C|nr:GNAT family N-acetyltransferase [Bacillus sp. B1-b2]